MVRAPVEDVYPVALSGIMLKQFSGQGIGWCEGWVLTKNLWWRCLGRMLCTQVSTLVSDEPLPCCVISDLVLLLESTAVPLVPSIILVDSVITRCSWVFVKPGASQLSQRICRPVEVRASLNNTHSILPTFCHMMFWSCQQPPEKHLSKLFSTSLSKIWETCHSSHHQVGSSSLWLG